jgi:LysM repeat protein
MATKVTVTRGDTLSAIARANKTTVAKIIAANPQIVNANRINVGQRITIPTRTAAKPAPAPKPAAPKVTSTALGSSTQVFPGDFGDGGVASLPTAISGSAQVFPGDFGDGGVPGRPVVSEVSPQTLVTQSGLNTGPTRTQVDSIAAIKALLSSYGIGDLSDAITNAVVKGYSTDTIELIMQDPNSNDPLAVAFQMRFPANKARAAAGKSVLSPAEYLRAERSYTEVLKSYGVSNLASKEKLSQFISNDISATEVSDRVGLAINRVQNADPDTKKALAEYYPMLNQADIVGAVLDPTEGLPALQRKIQIAEIGGAALAQGIKTSEGKTNIMMGAETLANLGVTQAKAREGFEQVADVTPRGSFLTSISASGQQYGQLQAEQEAFQGLASAKRARQVLTAEEQARFGGSAGTSKASLASQTRGAI